MTMTIGANAKNLIAACFVVVLVVFSIWLPA